MYKDDLYLISGKAPISFNISYDEAQIRVNPNVSMNIFNNIDIDLKKLPEDKLYGMVYAFCSLSSYDALFVWLHYFIGKSMRDIENEYGLTIAKQRTIYSKFTKSADFHSKQYLKSKKKGVFNE